ncbi:MAG: DUF3179 domain-containing protein [Aquabacterium sp.]|nr:DUF3179 domain-containing protein [Aquabacterium sp.]
MTGRVLCIVAVLAVCSAMPSQAARPQAGSPQAVSAGAGAGADDPAQRVLPANAVLPLQDFLALLDVPGTKARAALARIDKQWRDGYAAMLLEGSGFMPDDFVQRDVLALLARKSGLRSTDVNALYEWLWATAPPLHPQYAEFKARLYEVLDPQFREHFAQQPKTAIRLDEIRWGGVRRDGIPPLKNPKMTGAAQAGWLADDDIVFGVAIDGDVRAYPKRILAWHEMVKDRIAGRELNGVYCTLCGAMVLYDTTVDGVHHELGTSGFLYRSNKLMYDHATKSLWSTLTGTPVVGPLVGQGITLRSLHLVTTTWKAWRQRHPTTRVLSPDTGHLRDYSEGAAYRRYFATDELMFNVPRRDTRLANKAEVLALRFAQAPGDALAISAQRLLAERVLHAQVGPVRLVVLTDDSGANRVYQADGAALLSWNGQDRALDAAGVAWRVAEDGLHGPLGQVRQRLPAHRAFWFGWVAAFPTTRLVK